MAEGATGYTESETERVQRHPSLYNRHSRDYAKSVSLKISTVMTRLWCGEEIRRWRVEKYREYDRILTSEQSDVTIQTAGSKAEGLTCFLESDRDMFYVLKGVLCVEAGINPHTIPNDIDVFKMDTRVYPGHCRLLQERPSHTRRIVIHHALCENGYGDVLLRSSLLLDALLTLQPTNLSVVLHEQAGPSRPGTFKGILNVDKVTSLRCHCPRILQRWAARPRHWPPLLIVQKVVLLGAYVTPVGFKGSKNKHMEWRICFNTGEAELVNNLNDTQAKVYVILKMILKDKLKPNYKEITSYVLKNIILWQAKNTPQTEFHARSLLYWLHDGLRELRTVIEKKQLLYDSREKFNGSLWYEGCITA
ncbi:uncharacterized protein LOC127850738 [Dreissena polymorpha]|uniref:Mab-21-like HhH/H2TH-like domain-containing protein n=1 Tax=Dreissena polymorpha TaxID=45954 RepID=A0A9D4CWI5_DREPO|nr:uncharacterized protein LOC127850738 [Dreissena polymorpha]KAH3733311.1 hypothetical protein DPMN_039737 [Dreissena polymorpha]